MTNDSPPPSAPNSFGREFTEDEKTALEWFAYRLDTMSDEDLIIRLLGGIPGVWTDRRPGTWVERPDGVALWMSEPGSIPGINEETPVSDDQRSA